MIGEAYVSTVPFYDKIAHKMSFKNRPVLIIGQADNDDYVVLPISSVTNKLNLDAVYDYTIDPIKYPLLNLKHISYVRTHKQQIIHSASLVRSIVDFRSEYPEAYLDIISKVEQFQKGIINNAF